MGMAASPSAVKGWIRNRHPPPRILALASSSVASLTLPWPDAWRAGLLAVVEAGGRRKGDLRDVLFIACGPRVQSKTAAVEVGLAPIEIGSGPPKWQLSI
jgi:hypothetical protein